MPSIFVATQLIIQLENSLQPPQWGLRYSLREPMSLQTLKELSCTLYLKPRTFLPAAVAGAVCYYGGWLCFSNGTSWFRSDGVTIT